MVRRHPHHVHYSATPSLTTTKARPQWAGQSENDLWLEAWMSRWVPVLAKLLILFGAGALVNGWLNGGVL